MLCLYLLIKYPIFCVVLPLFNVFVYIQKAIVFRYLIEVFKHIFVHTVSYIFPKQFILIQCYGILLKDL